MLPNGQYWLQRKEKPNLVQRVRFVERYTLGNDVMIVLESMEGTAQWIITLARSEFNVSWRTWRKFPERRDMERKWKEAQE